MDFNFRKPVNDEPTPDEERTRLTTGTRLPSRRTTPLPSTFEVNPPTSMSPMKSAIRKSLTAASKSLTNVLDSRSQRTMGVNPQSSRGAAPDTARQILAWEMYDQVGELREATHLIADTVAGADLYVGHVIPGEQQPERVVERVDRDGSPLGTPEREDLRPEEVVAVEELLATLVESGTLTRMATQMFVAAETFLLGIPRDLSTVRVSEDSNGPVTRINPDGLDPEVLDDELIWEALSFDEIRTPDRDDGTMEVMLEGEWHRIYTDRVFGINIWQAHPRRSDRLDSGVLSALPILLQLVAINQYAGAAIDSRLSGAGVFVIPHSALSLAAGADREEVAGALDDFMATLTEAMVTPIEDRSSPSAVVPITIAVPDESTGSFERYTFEVPLTEVVDQREEHLIRRLARSLDLPVEQLLGVGDLNHWSAWQVDEATVKAHVDPMLRSIVRELTLAILWPTLEAKGMDAADARKWAIGFDTSRLVLRPNRSTEAQWLYEHGETSGDTLRRSMGFDDSDAPQPLDLWQKAIDQTLTLFAQRPEIGAQEGGLRAVTEGIYSLLKDNPPDSPDTSAVEGDLDIVPNESPPAIRPEDDEVDVVDSTRPLPPSEQEVA